jgi:quercetin dioxygenase-like cupin family protein
MRILASVALISLTMFAFAQSGGEHHKLTAQANIQTMELDVLPACMKIAAMKGDPFKEAATIYAEMEANCVVPFHWHTPVEELMMVSGTAKLESHHSAAETVQSGAYIHFPSKNVHQFTCTGKQKCTFYLLSSGPFDIHYVDKAGNEIPVEKALKNPGKKAADKKM